MRRGFKVALPVALALGGCTEAGVPLWDDGAATLGPASDSTDWPSVPGRRTVGSAPPTAPPTGPARLLPASWVTVGPHSGAHHGAAVASAGDVNGDGHDDVIVGAPDLSDGESGEGRAAVFLGAAGGPSTTAAWTVDGGQVDAALGAAVGSAGDVNGDGYDDVLVGAPDHTSTQTREGRVRLFLGSAAGPATAAAWTFEPGVADAAAGWSVAGAGDVNSDGYDDVLVGAPGLSNGEVAEGRAYLFLGGAGGLAATPAWTTESDHAGGGHGFSVAGAGDVNGDGYHDVVVGAPGHTSTAWREGRAAVYLGSATGLATVPAWTVGSGGYDAALGSAVAGAGDVNGDGYGDVIVGAPGWSDGQPAEGRAWVYLGGPTGPAATAAWDLVSDQDQAQLGGAVAGAGDTNGDPSRA